MRLGLYAMSGQGRRGRRRVEKRVQLGDLERRHRRRDLTAQSAKSEFEY